MATTKTAEKKAVKPESAHCHCDDKLCAMACCTCRTNVKELRPLVKNAKFICQECGRAAAKAANLCQPVRL
jgi:hypothetical protein